MSIVYSDKTAEGRKISLLKVAAEHRLLFIDTLELEDLEDLLLYTKSAVLCSECGSYYDSFEEACIYCKQENPTVALRSLPPVEKTGKKASTPELDLEGIYKAVKFDYSNEYIETLGIFHKFQLKSKKGFFCISEKRSQVYIPLESLPDIQKEIRNTKDWKIVKFREENELLIILKRLENEL